MKTEALFIVEENAKINLQSIAEKVPGKPGPRYTCFFLDTDRHRPSGATGNDLMGR